MTPKTELFGRIEDYCFERMDAQERMEFEQELKVNEELREEVEIHKNIEAAITELDVLDLKSKLENIQTENKPTEEFNASFELIEELTEIEAITEELAPEELINSFESLPKVHAYQHEVVAKENIHQYYKEQHVADEILGLDDDLNGFDVEGLEGLEEAVLEADILNLRETIQQVAKTVEPQYSVEDIDDYLNGELSDDILAEFEPELEQNEDLLFEVNLHKDIENAIDETEIMNLRDELRNIVETETSWNVSEKSIEDFIDGMIEEDLLEEFNAELTENTDLMAEVALRKNINNAIGETDIQGLRASLGKAREAADKQEVKSIVMPRFEVGKTRFWRNSVAMIVVLIGLSGILNIGLQPMEKSYSKFYDSPTWTSERSVASEIDKMQIAKIQFQSEEWSKVLTTLNTIKLPKEEAFVAQFYKGLSYQNLESFDKAIKEYSSVINHGNNLFIEEAEWYKSLCYLKLDDKATAKKELLAVISRKGHYESDARAILRRLRYSIK